MEFTIYCPNDGEVVVDIGNIENMVVRDNQQATITFKCPICGENVTMTAPVPSFLISTLENLSKEFGLPHEDGKFLLSPFFDPEKGPDEAQRKFFEQNMNRPMRRPQRPRHAPQEEPVVHRLDAKAHAQMDYFKHQLEDIYTIDELLSELD